MDDFELIAPHLFKCKHCGTQVPSGIINISGHWVSCGGKDFYRGVLTVRENKGAPLTIKDIELLQEEHL